MINNLPSEILQQIFHKLHEKRDIKRIRLVCKRWHGLLKVETIMIDPSKRGHAYKKLLIDFDRYSQFSTGLKKLAIRDSYWYYTDDDLCYGSVESKKDKVSLCSDDLVGDTFSSIVQYCHNLTGVEISMNCSKNLLGHLERLQDMSKLESLCLDLSIDYQSPHFHSDDENLLLLLDQFFERFGSSLRFFTMTQTKWEGNINYCWGMGGWSSGFLLSPACKAIDNSNTMLINLEKIEIIGGCYGISKECLEYFISGQLGCLNTLNLCLRVQGITNGTEGTIWDQIKEYCVSHLKHYNILLVSEGTSYSNEILFSFDNCVNKEESYYQLYNGGVKYSGEFPEPTRCRFRESRMLPLIR